MEYVYGLIGLIVLVSVMVFAIYDFKNSVGEFAGILGELALKLGESVVIGLLIIDIIVWKVNKGRKE